MIMSFIIQKRKTKKEQGEPAKVVRYLGSPALSMKSALLCRERDRLQEGPLRHFPSEMHGVNHARPRMEMTAKLLDLALGAVGPVQLDGRLFENAMSVVKGPEAAPADTQAAKGLFVEIVSPINGKARKAK